MKVYNEQSRTELQPELHETLADIRLTRGFDAAEYIDEKTEALNRYAGNHALQGCVVAVSGGLDSAVVLGLVKAAADRQDSPIKTVVPVALPVFSKDGATNQEEALERGIETAAAFGLDSKLVDLTAGHAALKDAVDASLDIDGEAWASGQLVSYVRTPALYYITSLLSQQGIPSVVCGTTNKDEGGYLGYFGKASDGMVDLQLISDIHKSEVRTVAGYLGVPESVQSVAPSGDMYDGRIDEEVFGAPYDFIELYLHYLTLNPEDRLRLGQDWGSEALDQFKLLGDRLEKMHGYNAHKYLGKSPAVHLDVFESAIPGGWSNRYE